MKKLLSVLLITASALAVTVASSATYEEIKKAGTLTIVTEGEYAPFNFFEGKKLTGYEIEVAEAVAGKMGLKVKWEIVPFDAQITAIGQGRFDLAIASHGFSEERAKAVDFAKPHYCSGGIIVTRSGGPLTAKDIAGKTAAAQIGTSYLTSLEKLGTLKKINTYRGDPDAFLALKNKRVDVWVSDRFTAKETLKKDKGPFVTGEMLFQEAVSAIFPKKSTELMTAWNNALELAIKDGTIAKISQKYFNEDVTCK